MNATRGRSRYVSFGLSLLLSHHVGDCPRRSEIVDGASDINCQQHDRLRNRLSHVSVWLYSSKSDLHLCIRISIRSWVKQTYRHQICAGSGKVRSVALPSTQIQTLGRTFTVPRTTLRRTRFPFVSASRQRKVTKNCRDYCNTVFQ